MKFLKPTALFLLLLFTQFACTLSDPEMMEVLMEIKAQNEKLLQEVEKMKSQLDALDGKYQVILASLADNKKELEELKAQIDSLKAQIALQLEKIDQLSAQLELQGADIIKLSAEIEELKASCEELKGLIEQLLNNAIANQYSLNSVFCANGPTEIIDVVNPVTGKIWMDRNLGAKRAATSITDEQAFGDLYQWGRGSDGHQCRNSKTIVELSITDQPLHGNFILAVQSPHDWRSGQNVNLWQKTNMINNPCPNGFRLPTETELNEERLSWNSNNSIGAFNSPLKFTLSGNRNESDGIIHGIGITANYWSSSIFNGYSKLLNLGINDSQISYYVRGFGNSVRCIKS